MIMNVLETGRCSYTSRMQEKAGTGLFWPAGKEKPCKQLEAQSVLPEQQGHVVQYSPIFDFPLSSLSQRSNQLNLIPQL